MPPATERITPRAMSTVLGALGSVRYANAAFYSTVVRCYGDEFLEELRPLELSRVLLGLAQGGCHPKCVPYAVLASCLVSCCLVSACCIFSRAVCFEGVGGCCAGTHDVQLQGLQRTSCIAIKVQVVTLF